jgi:PAS domain S-box-containing protein
MTRPTVPEPSTLLDLLVDTVFVVDAQGQFLYASASCFELLGYTPDELRGHYMIEFVHPDDRGATLNTVWQIMNGEPTPRFENRWQHKDGSAVRLQWAARWSPEHLIRVAVARRVDDAGR